MNRIILAYCHDNAELAEQVEHDLSRIGIPFDHLTNQTGEKPGHLSTRLHSAEDPVVLFVTDNFFKSRDCMDGALAAVQALQRSQRLLVVVADGKISRDGGTTFERVETHFDRMVYALQYMNFWQSEWLALSDRYQQSEGSAKATLELEMNASRNIANEIGELIGVLREGGYVSWEQFLADDYMLFFKQFGLQEWHAQYRLIAKDSYIPQDSTPPIPPTAPVRPLSETPIVAGGLVPAPTQTDTVATGSDFAALNFALETEKSDTNGHFTNSEITTPTPADDLPPQTDWDFANMDALHFDEETESPIQDAEDQIEHAIRDAWVWIEQGYTDRGIELLQFTLEQHPDNLRIQQEYQLALAKTKPQPPATETWAAPEPPPAPIEVSAPEPSLAENECRSYNLMGDMAAEKGDYLFAKYCWDRVADLNPDFPGIFRKLGLMTSEHLRDYRETALHYLKKSLEHQPDDAEVLLALAHAYQENENAAEANTHYAQAVMLAPSLRSAELDQTFGYGIATTASPEVAPEAPSALAPSSGEVEPAPQPVVEPREVLTVLVTGATSGIGRATAEIFARHGHRVILTGRRVERLVLLKTQFEEELRADVLMLPFDVREPGAVQAALDNLPESWQNIDILVNNAGLAKGLAPIHEGDIAHWEQMIDTNIKGLLYVTRAIAPGMVARRRGHIINIGSSAGKEVYANGNVYCATKFAVEALTRGIRLDLHKHNIRVSQVSPGHVEETEFAITRFDGDAERARIYDDFQPLKSSDVAEAIYWMATRPPHVNVQDVQMYATQQASATVVDRSGR